MEIRFEKDSNTVTFFELDRGEVFKHKDSIYMKTNKGQGATNAVCLNDGILVQFFDTEEVIDLAEAYLTVKE